MIRSLARRCSAAVVALLASFLTPVVSSATPGAPVDSTQTIALEPYLGVLWAFHARLGDRDGLFLLDTGGGLTIVTPKATGVAGCTPWGRLTGFRMRGDRLDLPRCDDVRLRVADIALSAPVAGVWDLMAKLPPDAPELMGSVALDAFAGRVVTLDIAHRRLIIESPQSFAQRARHAREVSARYSREIQGLALTPFAGVVTPSGIVWMELDSGSDGSAVVGRHIAGQVGLDPSIKGGQDWTASLAGGVALKSRALVDDLVYDGNLGVPVLTRWAVTFDLDKGRLWIDDTRQASLPQPSADASGTRP